MSLEADIQLIDSGNDLCASRFDGREVISFDFDLCGENLQFNISAGTGMVGLGAIVPVARAICDKITDCVVQKNIEQGRRIPCCQGCSNCCKYLVTVSSAEVFSFADDVKKLDSLFYKYVQRKALLACKKMLKKKSPVFSSNYQLDALSDWYKSLNFSCPFLFEGHCSIYDVRPIACREYFITGSPNVCKSKRGSAEVLQMPVSLANILNDFCAEMEGQSDVSIMLPLFQVWANENSERKMRQFPAEHMVRTFVELFEKAVLKNKEKIEICCH